MGRNVRDWTGHRHGKLTVLYRVLKTTRACNRPIWMAQCDCGNTTLVPSYDIPRNKSCGCMSKRSKNFIFDDIIMIYTALSTRHANITGTRTNLIHIETCRILSKSPCHYCGRGPSNNFKGITYQGIDRIDSSIGYSDDNCVPCCARCNHSKWDMTTDEYRDHLYRQAAYQQKTGW